MVFYQFPDRARLASIIRRQISGGRSHYFTELFATAASERNWSIISYQHKNQKQFGWKIAVQLLWTQFDPVPNPRIHIALQVSSKSK
jgi:hypothetical protein